MAHQSSRIQMRVHQKLEQALVPEHQPPVHLQPMPQLIEALGQGDDWTGLKDAAARRKRQNRLNVRAYHTELLKHSSCTHGRRKAFASKAKHEPVISVDNTSTQKEPTVPCWVEDQQAVAMIPASIAKTFNPKMPLLPQDPSPAPSKRSMKRIVFPLSSDHLITLLQYNVLRASMVNDQLTSVLRAKPPTGCSSSPLQVLPLPSSLTAIPATLYPTTLQLTVPHEDWIDNIPHPIWRDNLIRAAGTYDEDDLWSDTMGGLFEGFPQSESERRGVIAWWPPWNASGWELSEGFWRKWRWSLENCEDVLAATNHWREKRGEKPIDIEEIS